MPKAAGAKVAQRDQPIAACGIKNTRTWLRIGVMAEDFVSRVVVLPGVRSGQPIIAGTRVTVWDILGWLGTGTPEAEILDDYPYLKHEDVVAAIQFAYSLKDKIGSETAV